MLEMVSTNNPEVQIEYDIQNIYDIDLNLIRFKASANYLSLELAMRMIDQMSGFCFPWFIKLLKKRVLYRSMRQYLVYCNILYPYTFMNKYVKCHWMFRRGYWPTRPGFSRRALRLIIPKQIETCFDLIYRNSYYGIISIDYLISRGLL